MDNIATALVALYAAHALMEPGGARELLEDAIRALGGDLAQG